jgi:hypothetical protein
MYGVIAILPVLLRQVYGVIAYVFAVCTVLVNTYLGACSARPTHSVPLCLLYDAHRLCSLYCSMRSALLICVYALLATLYALLALRLARLPCAVARWWTCLWPDPGLT